VVLYRSLRKAEEDTKNEPGAADFYYGEMEMRRNIEDIPRAERLILQLYWLVSGYALRAWRSVATLTAIVLLAAVAFAFWGFPASGANFRPVGINNNNGTLIYQQRPPNLPSGLEQLPAAIRFSAQSSTALLRGPDRTLTPLGDWLEILLSRWSYPETPRRISSRSQNWTFCERHTAHQTRSTPAPSRRSVLGKGQPGLALRIQFIGLSGSLDQTAPPLMPAILTANIPA
jgi:hypothetical protein